MTARAWHAAVLVGLVAGSATRDAEACAACRNPTLPVTRGSEGPIAAGDLRAGISATGTQVHVIHEAGCEDVTACTEVPIQPRYLHDQRMVPVELRLSAEYGFSPAFGLELQMPFRVVTTTIDFATPAGEPYEPLDPDVHHRNETVTGPADPWLLGRLGTTIDRWWLAVRAGVTLPLGRTEENPFALGDRGERHQHIQLGSGSFYPVAIVETSRSFGPVAFQAFAQGQAALYENTHGYRAPWRVHVGTSVGTTFVDGFGGSIGPEVFHEDAERWDGVVRQDGNLGRTEILAAGTLTQQIDATQLSLGVRAPLWRDIVEGSEDPGTLSSPVTLSLGVTYVLKGPGDDPPTTARRE
jgi:hypothetical protein